MQLCAALELNEVFILNNVSSNALGKVAGVGTQSKGRIWKINRYISILDVECDHEGSVQLAILDSAKDGLWRLALNSNIRCGCDVFHAKDCD